jgi:hypothetical protein
MATSERHSHGYAGDLLLTLAQEGRLVLDEAAAGEVVAGLERTIAEIDARIRRSRRWHNTQPVPSGLLRARRELPKYLAAVRIAGRPPGNVPVDGEQHEENP